MVPDPIRLEWTGAPGRAFLTRQGDASDVEAALGTSHRLNGTARGRDPAILNGRRRGTKDFLGRVADTMQWHEPRTKARATDPVDVFGAASAVANIADKPSMRTKPSRLRSLPRHHEKRRNYSFRIPGCALLTGGAIDGLATCNGPEYPTQREESAGRTMRAASQGECDGCHFHFRKTLQGIE
jgi:hypothetical protein